MRETGGYIFSPKYCDNASFCYVMRMCLKASTSLNLIKKEKYIDNVNTIRHCLNNLFGSQIGIMAPCALKMDLVILMPKVKKIHNLPVNKLETFRFSKFFQM